MTDEMTIKSQELWIHDLDQSVPQINRAELKQIKIIGKGACADVYHYKHKGTDVAIKVLRSNPIPSETISLKMEVSIGVKLPSHPHIVRMFGLTEVNGWLGIVMELADYGCLREAIYRNPITLAQKAEIGLNICFALDYLHSRRIAHLDLKPDNVLLFLTGNKLTAKLADFGTSRVIKTLQTNTRLRGTPAYIAPERMNTEIKYGVSADVYSLSILLYELFSELAPFSGYSEFEIYAKVQKNQRPDFPQNFPEELRNVIAIGWSSIPGDRPRVKEFEAVLIKMIGEDEIQVLQGVNFINVFCSRLSFDFWCLKLQSWLLGLKFWHQKFCTKNARKKH